MLPEHRQKHFVFLECAIGEEPSAGNRALACGQGAPVATVVAEGAAVGNESPGRARPGMLKARHKREHLRVRPRGHSAGAANQQEVPSRLRT